jgi:hypothetical protein
MEKGGEISLKIFSRYVQESMEAELVIEAKRISENFNGVAV